MSSGLAPSAPRIDNLLSMSLRGYLESPQQHADFLLDRLVMVFKGSTVLPWERGMRLGY